MQKPGHIAMILCWLILSHICEAAIGPQPQADGPVGTAEISGRVLLNGEPASGVSVVLIASGQSGNSFGPVKSDKSGHYRIIGLLPGKYTLMATSPGYITAVFEGDYSRRGKPVSLVENEKIENIDLELRRGGVITGRVTDVNKQPLIEEPIRLMRFDRSGEPRPVREYMIGAVPDALYTDDRGEYRIYGLPEGRYLISVGREVSPNSIAVIQSATFSPLTFYPDALTQSEAKAVDVSEGIETAGIDITVNEQKRTYSIMGRVIHAETGKPIEGLQLSYGKTGSNGNRIGVWASNGEQTNALGEFQLHNIIPGKYAVFAEVPSAHQEQAGKDLVSETAFCEVVDAAVQGLEVRVRQGAAIVGTVVMEGSASQQNKIDLSRISLAGRSQPLPGLPPPTPGIISAKIQPDGNFRLGALPGGNVLIYLSGNPYPGLTIARIEQNGIERPEGISLKAGDTTRGVKVFLKRGTLSIQGAISVIGGSLPAGMRIFVSAMQTTNQASLYARSNRDEADARGRFVIENLQPGEYELTLSTFLSPEGIPIDSHTYKAIHAVRKKILVTEENSSPVTLSIDLTSRQEIR